MSTSSLFCADDQEFLVFAGSSVPMAEITEVEIAHSMKSTEGNCITCGTAWRRKQDPHPHVIGVGLSVSVHTAATGKSKKKVYFITF